MLDNPSRRVTPSGITLPSGCKGRVEPVHGLPPVASGAY